MLLRIFKGTGPGVVFLIVITLVAIWISAILNQRLHPRFIYETDPMPLYGLLKDILNNNHNAGVLVSFLMVCAMAFLLVNFSTDGFFIDERTFLPALFYILYGGLFPDHQLLNPVIPASIFLMLGIKRIMEGYHITGTAYNYFDAGLLISIGSLFYANLVWFGLLVFIGIALLRTGNLREIAISVAGLITPYLITLGVYYVLGKDPGTFLKLLSENLHTHTPYYPFARITIVFLIFSLALLFMSMSQLMKVLYTKKIKSRKTFSLLIWTFLISVAVYIFVPSVSVEMIWITGMPVAYFLSHYFIQVRKKVLPEVIFTLIFVFILLIQIWHLR
jgi:hypothetical protein